jgi:hypothetical protein
MSLRRLGLVALVLVAAALRPPAAQAQAERLIAGARARIEDLDWDSAATLLNDALRSAATPAERTRTFTLLAITQLSKGDRGGARAAFEQALRLDAALKVDSLAELQSDVRVVFGEVRAAMGIADAPRNEGAPRLAVTVDLPPDTSVPATGGLLRIETRPTYRARVVTVVTPADQPGLIVWSDTQLVGGIHTGTWNLRGREGTLVAPGRYSLRVTARDSAQQVSPTSELILAISREVGDTTPLPPALTAAAFAPESRTLAHASPSALAAGLAIAAAVVVAPSALANAGVQKGAAAGSAYAVAGVVSAASIVGYLRGTRVQPLPENIAANARTRQQDAAERLRIAEANARQRQQAPVRVRVEGTGP